MARSRDKGFTNDGQAWRAGLSGRGPGASEEAHLPFQFFDGRMGPDDPVIPYSCRPLHCSVGIGGDPDRRPRFLQRLGIDGYILDMKLLAMKAHVIFSPKLFNDLDAFDEALESLCVIQVKGIELLVPIAQAEGCEGSSVVDDIQSGELVGHCHWMAQAKKHHCGADLA